MKKVFITVMSVSLFFSTTASSQAVAQVSPRTGGQVAAGSPDEYVRGKVILIVEQGRRAFATEATEQPYQLVRLRVLSGPQKGEVIEVRHGYDFPIRETQKVAAGQTVVLVRMQAADGIRYIISDTYRLPWVGVILGIFLVAVIFWGRLRGVGSVVGLLISLLILIKYVIPTIVAGGNPVVTSLVGAIAIAVLSLYPAHGFSRRTSIALVSILVSLGLAAVLAWLFVDLTRLLGLGSEEAIYVQMDLLKTINLKGLLLGGIIIGALGVLDDITTGQAAAVDEIHKANPTLSYKELFKRGLSVGREHITSLVNTLALAYIGAAFPLLLMFNINYAAQPLWAALNDERIIEEIIRTLVGSTTLVFAVPLTTALMVYSLKRWRPAAAPGLSPE